MLAYFAILGSAVAGYSGLPPYAMAATAIALASISFSEHAALYEKARVLGGTRVVHMILLLSLRNGLMAAVIAYFGGWALQHL